MATHSFTMWLRKEAASLKYALLNLYEQRDRMIYMEGPELEQTYMIQIGSYEETVIREEMECELLEKKQNMIQAAINRREPVNEKAIDEEIDRQRAELLKEAGGGEAPQAYASLPEDKYDKLQTLYREIVEDFHPQMHPEHTEVHKELFEKAQDCYRCRDLAALELVHEMLYSTKKQDGGITLELMMSLKAAEGSEDGEENALKENKQYDTDYTLAEAVYEQFVPIQEEAVLKDEITKNRLAMDTLMMEIEQKRTEFPYSAAAMLADSQQIADYKKELELRMLAASKERKMRTAEIEGMMEEVNSYAK